MEKQERESIGRREFSFRNTDMPLMSKRVRVIMSNPEDAKRLMKAVRTKTSFTLTRKTEARLNKLRAANG